MRVLFLRGKVDCRTQRVNWLEDSWDMWEHLASYMGDEVKILYAGGTRRVWYCDKVSVEWIDSFKCWHTKFKPDVIFARGGFDYYKPILERFPNAFRVYYGAGRRTHPKEKYDMVLVDDERDVKDKEVLWTKPVAPHFYERAVEKEFDVCYIANKQQADIKRIPWVYRTAPNLKILHLGYQPRIKRPNITQLRVSRGEMPEQISRCYVGIAPYTDYDSGPRAVAEMVACGLPVIVTPDTRCNYDVFRCSKQNFWEFVEWVVSRERSL
jgi:glycosyltransferase involved in cell wall biosynthesis